MGNDMTGFNGVGSAKKKFRAETLRAQFAEIIQAVRYEDLPPEVVILSKKCLLDFIGVTLAGGDLGISPIATRLIGSLGGKAEASVVGKDLKLPSCSCLFEWRPGPRSRYGRRPPLCSRTPGRRYHTRGVSNDRNNGAVREAAS